MKDPVRWEGIVQGAGYWPQDIFFVDRVVSAGSPLDSIDLVKLVSSAHATQTLVLVRFINSEQD